jgi:hypothetical protein
MFGLLVIVAASGVGAPALGADCGGATACSCGDTVIESRTLVCGVDPVTTTICTGDGLIVARLDPLLDPPVDLNLNFCIIRGDGGDVGIVIADDDVTVRSGKITGFDTGVATDTDTTGSLLTGLQVYGNGKGVDITASGTTVKSSVIGPNEGDCLIVRNGPEDDDGNVVSGVRCEGSGICEDPAARGIVIRGSMNKVTGNVARRLSGDGFDVAGNRTTLSSNRSEYNCVDGFHMDGSRHTVTLNYALRNGADGFLVFATDSRFDRNRSDYNGDWGIEDDTIGGGTSMTANFYTNNRCTGNVTGKSSPPDLCK